MPGGPIDKALEHTQLSEILTAKSNPTIGNDLVFPQAILSFATVVFGVQHKQSDIVRRGYAIHGTALKHLNKALSEPSCYTCDGVLLSIVTFALLECLVPTGPNYHLTHMLGLDRLLDLRQRSSYESPQSAALYKGIRHMILFAALHLGKPSTLARPEWKAVLRKECSEAELQEQEVFDLLADCTVLVWERDTLSKNQKLDLEQKARKRDDIQRRGLALLTQLQNWRKRWDANKRNAHVETPMDLETMQSLQGGNIPPPISSVYIFTHDDAATTLLFYQTSLIYVLRLLASLLPEENQDPTQKTTQEPTPHEMDALFPISYPQDPIQYTTAAPSHIEPGSIFSIPVTLNPLQPTPSPPPHPHLEHKNNKTTYHTSELSAALSILRCLPYHFLKQRAENRASPITHLAINTAWVSLGGHGGKEGSWMRDLLGTESRDVVVLQRGIFEAGEKEGEGVARM